MRLGPQRSPLWYVNIFFFAIISATTRYYKFQSQDIHNKKGTISLFSLYLMLVLW